jgi:AraC family transcriptional regulator
VSRLVRMQTSDPQATDVSFHRAGHMTGSAGRASNFSCGVRLSSRSLGWRGLELECREASPPSKSLPSGAGQHLVIVSLGRGRIARESCGESVKHDLHPGSVAVYPAGHSLCWSWSTRLKYFVFSLDPDFLNQVARRIYGVSPGDFELVETERDYDFAIADLAGAALGSHLNAESVANILALHLLRNYAKWARGSPPGALVHPRTDMERVPRGREPVQRAIRYIQENHARDIGLKDIAQAASLSRFHLARLFKHVVGVPPHQYLIQMRVQSAHSLLSAGAGKRSLAEVALAVGFSDQSHLTRHFKRVLGVTPSQLTSSTIALIPEDFRIGRSR